MIKTKNTISDFKTITIMEKILIPVFLSLITALLGFFIWQIKRLVSSIDGLKDTIQVAKTDIATQKTTCKLQHDSIDKRFEKIDNSISEIKKEVTENSSYINVIKHNNRHK